MGALAQLAKLALLSITRERRTLYLSERNGRWEAWAYMGGSREFVQARVSKGELEEWAVREGWEIMEV